MSYQYIETLSDEAVNDINQLTCVFPFAALIQQSPHLQQ